MDKADEQPTIKQADILATEFDRIRLAFDSVNRDRDRLKAIITCLRVNAIKGQDPEALLAFMRDGLEGIDAGLTIGEMVTAYSPTDNTRTTSLAAQEGLVEALRAARRVIRELDQYQSDPRRGDYGVECACCMGELLDDHQDAIAQIDAALSAIKEQHHD